MFTAEELRARLTREEFHVTQEKGTERAYTSPLTDFTGAGEYTCKVCGAQLFMSDDKFHSGCGWPSFAAPAKAAAVSEHSDLTLRMVRTEVTCSRCGAHLGHVFDDGGARSRTGLRYCINGVSIDFTPKK